MSFQGASGPGNIYFLLGPPLRRVRETPRPGVRFWACTSIGTRFVTPGIKFGPCEHPNGSVFGAYPLLGEQVYGLTRNTEIGGCFCGGK